MPVVISGGGAVATVADTPQIDLGLTNAQLTADVISGSIGSTQLSSAVNSALTLAGTAVQPAALTSYLPLSGGALTGAVTSTSTLTTRQSANTVQFLVSSGTAQTINWNSGGNINLDLSSATGNVTLTLQNPVSGATYRIRVQQGATVRNLTFPAGTVQQGGGGNVYTGIAGVDFLTVYYNGSDYLVQSALNSGFVQPTNNAIFTGVTQAAALRLNTVAVMISSTVPVTRADGTALVNGDLWYNSSTGIWGFWNGTYWLSENVHGINFALATVWGSAGTRTADTIRTIHPAYTGLFFENYSVLHFSGAGWDASNYSTFEVVVTSIGGNAFSMGTFTVNNVPNNGTAQWREFSLNYARTLTRGGGALFGLIGIRDVYVTVTKVGTAATVMALEYITYRGILS